MKDVSSVQQPNNEEISLKDVVIKLQGWWRYLLTKWIIIFVAGVIGGALGLTYAYLKKPIYNAELSFALEDSKSAGGLGGALGLASQLGLDMAGGDNGAFSGDNLLQLMKSRNMVEKTLLSTVAINGKPQTLVEMYISFNKFRNTWSSDPKLKNISFLPNADRSKFSLQQDSILGAIFRAIIKTDLVVDKTDKSLSMITISYHSKNELFAKLFAEGLAKNVSDFYIATKTQKSVQNVNILQHQTDSVRRQLNIAINGVASSTDAVPNANPGRQILRAPSQHKQVDVLANQAILTELVRNLEVSKATLRKETPLIQIIDTPILPLDVIRVGKLSALIIGGVLGGLLSICYLSLKRILQKLTVN